MRKLNSPRPESFAPRNRFLDVDTDDNLCAPRPRSGSCSSPRVQTPKSQIFGGDRGNASPGRLNFEAARRSKRG